MSQPSKISMFGVTSSGKTCFLYAMAQVVREVRHGDNMVQVISNRASQQKRLTEGYMELINRQWPRNSVETETFDFNVKMRCNGFFGEIIPSLQIQDYRGGILEDISKSGEKELDTLLNSFRDSSAIIFIIDGQTLIDAMDTIDRDACHRMNLDVFQQFAAKSQIEFVENIFMEYKRVEKNIPPILIAVSKGDVFTSDFEKENAKRFLREKLPSIFAVGSKMFAGITIMSLGENLGTNPNGGLTGTLKLSTDYNLHIPAIFGIYADLCYQYEETKDTGDKKGISVLLKHLRIMLAGRIQLYSDGRIAREV